jgi:hypothetical protein
MRRYPWCWAAAVGVAAMLAGRPAAAQQVLVQADGAVNVGYTQTTRDPIQSDPNGDPKDLLPSTTSSVYTEIRPGIVLQSGSPRLTWVAGYSFSGAFSLQGEASLGYSNQASFGLIGQISQFKTMSVNASIAQGGTSFLLSQAPAEMGKAEIRAPGNPSMVSATVAESFSWELASRLSMQQSFSASLSAPQDDLGERNTSLTDTLALDYMWGRDNVGLEIRGNVSRLRPLRADLQPFSTLTVALAGRWNHDFSASLNGMATAGVEQLYTDTGSEPLAFLPTASATARYTVGNITGGLEASHGSSTNIQVGTVSITDRIGVRGVITLDTMTSRVLSFSAGALHNEPIGEIAAAVAAGTGNAIQLDAGFQTQINKRLFANARYSLAYQFDQLGLSPTLTHVLMVGVTASYSNSQDGRRKQPRLGTRVDGSDGDGFPTVPATAGPAVPTSQP